MTSVTFEDCAIGKHGSIEPVIDGIARILDLIGFANVEVQLFFHISSLVGVAILEVVCNSRIIPAVYRWISPPDGISAVVRHCDSANPIGWRVDGWRSTEADRVVAWCLEF